jgi:hypothetical protein
MVKSPRPASAKLFYEGADDDEPQLVRFEIRRNPRVPAFHSFADAP